MFSLFFNKSVCILHNKTAEKKVNKWDIISNQSTLPSSFKKYVFLKSLTQTLYPNPLTFHYSCRTFVIKILPHHQIETNILLLIYIHYYLSIYRNKYISSYNIFCFLKNSSETKKKSTELSSHMTEYWSITYRSTRDLNQQKYGSAKGC